MTKTIFLTILFILFYGINIFAQDAKIIGRVYDGSNGSALPDAVIRVEPINKGAASDLDGNYSLENIKPGDYTVKASYVGYNSQTIKVSLKSGEVSNVDIILQPETVSVDTLTIEAERKENNDAALLLKQQKSDKITDGISEQQVKRSPDATTADVIKRVIGVTVVSDKFLFVRGTSERYSSTTLNGVQIPSTEPDKKAFTYDLFPSNLIENLVVSKSFTPDLPGNFSGGLVDITTKDIPDELTFGISTSTSYLSATSTQDNFLTYNATQKKFLFFNLGIDDGRRSLPSNFPQSSLISGNFSNEQLLDFSREFRNNWGQHNTKAPLNGGFNLTVGDKINMLKNPLGFFAAYTYRNSFSTKSVLFNDYYTDNTLGSSFAGQISTYKVDWGALINLSYKIGENHKFSLKNSFVQSAEDATQFTKGFTPDLQKKNYSTDYKERSLKSIILSGSHYLPEIAKMKVEWTASYSDAHRDEPDYKTLAYQRDPYSYEDPNYYASITTGSLSFDGGSRFFSTLFDISRSIKGDVEIPAKIWKLSGFKTKFGVDASGTRRRFDARLFAPQFYNYTNVFTQIAVSKESPDSIFAPENIKDSVLYFSEFTRNSDSYTATDNLYAGYLMFDASISKFRIVAGARLESYEQRLLSRTDYSTNLISIYRKNNDILPSVNLTYQLSDKMNIRGSYYQTVSRPEFREIAPFGFTDFTTREYVSGNPDNLHRTLIRNYDIRFEMFPKGGEVISLSLFYKHIDSPIEQVQKLTSGNPLRTYENAENGAKNYGIELEIRKNLGFLGEDFDYFSINGNLSLINSKINLGTTGSLAGNKDRRMQGQAPYALNLGLYYDNPNSGTSVNILFNKIGDRVSEVGLAGLNDEFEAGRDVLDFTVTQKFLSRFELKFAAKDLLNEDYKFYETNNGVDLVTKKYGSGINYALQLSYKY